ncbi:hypothetical protein DL93DRAFT_2087679 [Clavulina sp. PMI_390]|nr:hypothetical protein DL93DRAFT_2087679 [Clavulina sp. PMI_390]
MNHERSGITTSQECASPRWLERINLDIVSSIVEWLDPLSIFSLGKSCRYFRDAIGNDSHTWHRALQQVEAKYYIAPHSLDDLSISEMKLFSTRPAHLIKRLCDPARSLHAKTTKVVLDYRFLLRTPTSRDAEPIPNLEYLAAEMLPGGRWIVSGVVDHGNRATHVCVWDRSKLLSEETPLQPVATFARVGMRPSRMWSWFQAQFENPNSVILACHWRTWEK